MRLHCTSLPFARMTARQRTLPRPVHLTLDWDGTLTVNDTLSILSGLPKARDTRLAVAHTPTHSWNKDFLEPYMKDYTAHKRSSPFWSSTAEPEKYSQWLASLHAVEYNSAERVSGSGFFRGVNESDVATVAQNALDTGEMQLRQGWLDLFGMFLPASNPPPGSQMSILSVNWSATFIRSSLLHAARQSVPDDDVRRGQLIDCVKATKITANEIDGLNDLERGSSGRLVGNVRTAADKLQCSPLTSEHRQGMPSCPCARIHKFINFSTSLQNIPAQVYAYSTSFAPQSSPTPALTWTMQTHRIMFGFRAALQWSSMRAD